MRKLRQAAGRHHVHSQRKHRPNYSEDENVALSDVLIYRVSYTYSITNKRHRAVRRRLFVYEAAAADPHWAGKLSAGRLLRLTEYAAACSAAVI
ncbi:hypothetical protein D3P08_06525 [Paenibacillus nanensis]|uniref:Uncharacterized protein n=1 Tax=Paenibacillus nanensis TaxID=393251 RepID=A0A3A1UZJ2_9BACL|nr:hypothetical protein [Paenibacillus nanensis]RIX53908.1 hypothetical protein D3P08_06525 [Paenibacillus nanensis]